MQKYGNEFSKSSSILEICNKFKSNRKKYHQLMCLLMYIQSFTMTLWSNNAALFKQVARPTKVNGNDQFTIPQDNANPAAWYFSFQFIWTNLIIKSSYKEVLHLNVNEYVQEISQSHTADQSTALWERVTYLQSQVIRKTIKIKQPALSSSSRWLQT